jgi:hypothetical protein
MRYWCCAICKTRDLRRSLQHCSQDTKASKLASVTIHLCNRSGGTLGSACQLRHKANCRSSCNRRRWCNHRLPSVAKVRVTPLPSFLSLPTDLGDSCGLQVLDLACLLLHLTPTPVVDVLLLNLILQTPLSKLNSEDFTERWADECKGTPKNCPDGMPGRVLVIDQPRSDRTCLNACS